MDDTEVLKFMSVHDVEQLAAISRSINEQVKRTVAEATVTGVYFVLLSIAVFTIITRPRRTRRSWLLLSALVLTGILTTFRWGFNIAVLRTRTQNILFDSLAMPTTSQVEVYAQKRWGLPPVYVYDFLTGSVDTGMLVSFILPHRSKSLPRILSVSH
jgi:hypothetical protein